MSTTSTFTPEGLGSGRTIATAVSKKDVSRNRSLFGSPILAFSSDTTTLRSTSSFTPICTGADILIDTPSGPLTVATLGANDIVGEMAILGDVPRTATVQAKGRLVALRIAKDPFMRMVREFPNMAVSIMRELAHRLELTNNRLLAATTEVQRLRQGGGAAPAE